MSESIKGRVLEAVAARLGADRLKVERVPVFTPSGRVSRVYCEYRVMLEWGDKRAGDVIPMRTEDGDPVSMIIAMAEFLAFTRGPKTP